MLAERPAAQGQVGELPDREDVDEVEEQLERVTTRSAPGAREKAILTAAILRLGRRDARSAMSPEAGGVVRRQVCL